MGCQCNGQHLSDLSEDKSAIGVNNNVAPTQESSIIKTSKTPILEYILVALAACTIGYGGYTAYKSRYK